MKNYLDNFNLSEKTVFIVGSDGLIGGEIVKSCLDAGAKIVCFDIKKTRFIIKIIKKFSLKN